jgi:hypothetical protein
MRAIVVTDQARGNGRDDARGEARSGCAFRPARACSCTARPARSALWQPSSQAGAHVIGTGRAAGRQIALDFGPHEFVDLDNDTLEDAGGVDFVVVSDRSQLGEIGQWVRDGRLRTNIGTVAALDDAVAAFNPTERIKGRRSSAFVHRDAVIPD